MGAIRKTRHQPTRHVCCTPTLPWHPPSRATAMLTYGQAQMAICGAESARARTRFYARDDDAFLLDAFSHGRSAKEGRSSLAACRNNLQQRAGQSTGKGGRRDGQASHTRDISQLEAVDALAYNVVAMRLNRVTLASNICHPCPNLPNMKITPR